jgi:hypothetical protein
VADPATGEDEISGGRADTDGGGEGWLRRVVLTLIVLSTVGLLVELVLLEHYESAWQWTPLALLAVVLAITILVALRPTPGGIRTFQSCMVLCVVVGVLGLWLHYRGNVEFELERDTSLRGLALFWEALRGATPALAPGAMTQLGLLGLAYAHHHPVLGHSPTVRRPSNYYTGETP